MPEGVKEAGARHRYHAHVVALLALVLAWGAFVVIVARPWRRIDDDHALAGLLGELPREALIARWSDRVVATAERYERLDAFRRHLAERAWDGMPLHIEKGRRGWYRWEFSDGDAWHVRHAHRPRRTAARLIVRRSPDEDVDGLSVSAYVPGSHDVVLPVDDARHR